MRLYGHASLIPTFTFTNVPPPPKLDDTIKALQPSTWRLDANFWKNSYVFQENHKGTVCELIDQRIKNNTLYLSYNSLTSSRFSPRRIPNWEKNSRTLMKTCNESSSSKGKENERTSLFNISRVNRPGLLPPLGFFTNDFDLNQAHPWICAILSGDKMLKKKLKGDFHQDTGDLFAPEIKDKALRRKIGKLINSAILMGAGVQTLVDIVKKNSALKPTKDITKQRLENWKNLYSKQAISPQDTGDLFAPEIKGAELRQKIGLALNKALNVDVDIETIMDIIKETSAINLSLSEVKKHHYDWWKQFPQLVDFRKKHADYIRYLQSTGQEYKLKYGRVLAIYNSSVLRGKVSKKYLPIKDENWIYRSTWSAFITAYEAAIMEHVFVAAWKNGLKLGMPMFDGAMFHVPNGKDLSQFEADVQKILEEWNFQGGFKNKHL